MKIVVNGHMVHVEHPRYRIRLIKPHSALTIKGTALYDNLHIIIPAVFGSQKKRSAFAFKSAISFIFFAQKKHNLEQKNMVHL